MEGVTGRRGQPRQQTRRRYVFPWETGGGSPGEGQFCEKCAYFPGDLKNPPCLRCGRYTDNKLAEVIIVVVLTLLLAVFSNYALTGRAFRGTDMLWVNTGFQFPNSVYDSPEYRHAVIFTLAALVAAPVLAGFHYGARAGAALGCAAGFLSGVPYGGFVLPFVASIASCKRRKHLPPELWPIMAAACGIVYYFVLAGKWGPEDALYREALYGLLASTAELALLVVLVEILAVSWMNYRSWPIIPVTVFAAVGPAVLFFAGVGRPEFEANLLFYIYEPSRTLAAEFPEGYITGLSKSRHPALRPERQLGHVLEAAKYVDVVRSVSIGAADDYLKHFPKSPRAADMMLFKAGMYNALVDFAALNRVGRMEVYTDRISPEAIPVYREIIRKFPNSSQAALARLYIAESAFQQGDLLKAQGLLEEAESALERSVPNDFDAGELPAPANVRELYTDGAAKKRQSQRRVFEALLETRRLRRLIAESMDYAGQPLQRLAMLDPGAEGFEQKARDIIAHYPKSRLVDNVRLILAQRIWGPAERAAAIQALLEEYPDSDVRDEMLYEYARALYLANLTGQGALKARPVLQELLAKYPSSTCRFRAVSLLGKVNVAVATQARASSGAQGGVGTPESSL